MLLTKTENYGKIKGSQKKREILEKGNYDFYCFKTILKILNELKRRTKKLMLLLTIHNLYTNNYERPYTEQKFTIFREKNSQIEKK